MTSSIEPFLRALVDSGGSDLHCKVGSPPRVRIDGKLRRLQSPDLTGADTAQMLHEVLREDLVDEFRRTSEADFAYSLPRSDASASTPSAAAARPVWSSAT